LNGTGSFAYFAAESGYSQSDPIAVIGRAETDSLLPAIMG